MNAAAIAVEAQYENNNEFAGSFSVHVEDDVTMIFEDEISIVLED